MSDQQRPVERAFLNCNIDPEFFYRNLKALALLFDELVVWQPSKAAIESAKVDPDEVLEGFRQSYDGPAIIVPGGRPGYFDGGSRDTRGPPEFRLNLAPAAESSGTIIPRNADNYYDLVDRLGPSWSPYMDVIEESLTSDLATRSAEIQAKLANMGESRPSAPKTKVFFAEFLMDMGVCGQLGRPTDNTFPLVSDRWADAYRLINSASLNDDGGNPLGDVLERSPIISRNEHRGRFPDLPHRMDDFFHANLLPWSDIRKLKREIGPALRSYFRLRLPYDATDISDLATAVERTRLLVKYSDYFLQLSIEGLSSAARHYIAPGGVELSDLAEQARMTTGVDRQTFSEMVKIIPFAVKHSLAISNESNPATRDDPQAAADAEWGGNLVDFATSLLTVNKDIAKLAKKKFWNLTSVSKIAVASLEFSAAAKVLSTSREIAEEPRI